MKAADFRQQQAKQQTEKAFGLEVEELVTTLGLRYYHTHRSQHSVSGWPDYVILSPKGRGMLYRELKTESRTSEVSAEQQRWLDMLEANGCNVGVWRPRDLLSGRIVQELQAIR
jgi:hypothetical protein